MTFKEEHVSFLHFLTNVCAIVGGKTRNSSSLFLIKSLDYLLPSYGHIYFFFWHVDSGVFTVSGILDSFVYHGQKAIKKKMEIGKFS